VGNGHRIVNKHPGRNCQGTSKQLKVSAGQGTRVQGYKKISHKLRNERNVKIILKNNVCREKNNVFQGPAEPTWFQISGTKNVWDETYTKIFL
jgi:hypothetical protein